MTKHINPMAAPALLQALQHAHRTLRKGGYDMTEIDAAIELATKPATAATPGPYSVMYHSTDNKRDGAYIVDADGYNVAGLWANTCRSIEEVDANARLLASAPELLAALKPLVQHTLHYASTPHAHADAGKHAAIARAAIAKAGAAVE